MNRISMKTLVKVAVLGGMVIPVTGYGMRWLIQEKIKQSASCTEVTECISKNEEVKKILGEPFKIGRIEIGDNNSLGQIDNLKWFKLPLNGPKASGELIYWVKITNSANNEFHVSKIEIRVQERNGKKDKKYLLIRNTENTVESIQN